MSPESTWEFRDGAGPSPLAPVCRFAPAPTGFLHLGHVVNAIYVWGVTKAAGGTVLLRVEDHDRQRSRREYEQALLDDLEWLGFLPDSPSIEAFHGGPCQGRQSDRAAVYESALDVLRRDGRVYACDCSRAEILRAGGGHDELRYSGTCRDRQLPAAAARGMRVRLDDSVDRFDDLRHGPQMQRPLEQCGDILVRDREGNWTYQFVASVDDFVQGVTLVIRGDDVLASTGRQLQLARLLGRTHAPRFLHHPLVMKSSTQKLSKADGDTSVRDLRASGLTATEVIGRAASLVGLIEDGAQLAPADVAHLPPLIRFASQLSERE